MKQTTFFLLIFILLGSCNDRSEKSSSPAGISQVSIMNWRYFMNADFDSSRAIGKITFWRIPFYDSAAIGSQGIPGSAAISFEIFNIADSAFCREQSKSIKMTSSCVSPDVGGDIYEVGKYIFLNRDVCVSCSGSNSHVNLCRPVLDQLFSSLNAPKIESVDDILAQIDIPMAEMKASH